jgi:DNA topoisomerase-3
MTSPGWLSNRHRYLVLAEKPSQLKALKTALSSFKNLHFEALAGHCLSLVDLSAYRKELGSSWLELTKGNKVPFIPKKFKKAPSTSRTKEIIERVAAAVKNVDRIVLACDPDNEGMALGLEVLEYLKAEDRVVGAINTSKLDAHSLAIAIQDISTLPWKTMALAGMLRGEYDWSFGINGTILASVLLGQGETLHIGGVKLPTLRCVVEREDQILHHKAEVYYTVHGRARHLPSGQVFNFEVKVDQHTELSKRTAELVQHSLVELPDAVVLDFAQRVGLEQGPPKPFSLADLQSEAFARHRKSPANTLAIAQQLYEQGLISYPRTDCCFFANGQRADIANVLRNLRQQPGSIKDQEFPKPYQASGPIFQDAKVTAHTAISPTAKPPSALTFVLAEVYQLVAVRYAIQFMKKCVYTSTGLLCQPNHKLPKLASVQIQLLSTENVITDLGWKKLYKDNFGLDAVERAQLPQASKGDGLKILEVEVKEHTTRPPPRFTEASLIRAMEKISSFYPELKGTLKNGIGTAATRANIVQDLIKEGYFLSKSNVLHPTELGQMLIQTVPDSLSNAKRRANLEAQLLQVTRGELQSAEFSKLLRRDIEQCAADIQAAAAQKGIQPSSRKRKTGPSAKQLSFANSIAKRLKIKIPASTLESRTELSQWISDNQNREGNASGSMFSEKQRKIVLDNCQDPRILDLLESSNRADYSVVSKWIGDFLSRSRPAKLTEEDIIIELK